MRSSRLYSSILEESSTDDSPEGFTGEYLEDSEGTESLTTAWINTIQSPGEDNSRPHFYELAQKSLENTKVAPENVKSFCENERWTVEEYSYPSYPGIFISAAINMSESHEFEIPEGTELSCLGYNNQKKIRIRGDAGTSIGAGMSDGEIIIEGDVDEVGGDISNKMKGGDIYIKGEYGKLGSIEDGNIYMQKGGDWSPVR